MQATMQRYLFLCVLVVYLCGLAESAPKICSDDYECGSNARCNRQRDECFCEYGFEWAPNKVGCIQQNTKPRDPWNTCDESTCVEHAKCDPVTRQCQCKPGYERRGMECFDAFLLRLGEQCFNKNRTKCGNNAECRMNSGCTCLDNYHSSSNHIDCQLRSRLEAACKDHSDCGHNAYCDTGRCRCQPGGVPNQENLVDCIHLLNAQCSDDAQCPKDAWCKNSKCQCSTGYSPDTDFLNCVFTAECPSDDKCPQNAYCNITTYTCSCKDGFAKNSNTNECYQLKSNDESQGLIWTRWYAIVAYVALGLLIVGAVAGGIWFFSIRRTHQPVPTNPN